jgi:glutathione S-transferase
MAESILVVAYWGGIRGRCQAIRNFLEYLQLPYQDKFYLLHPDHFADWFEKDKLLLEKKNQMINLPYLIDGEKVISITDSIFHYLAYKAGKRN